MILTAEHEALLALGRLPGIGAMRGQQLLRLCGTAEAALSAPASVWEEALGRVGSKARAPVEADGARAARRWARAEARRLHALDGRLIGWGDDNYPWWLAQLPDAPLILYARGDRRLLRSPMVAIVGSRRCTSYGRRVAASLAEELTCRGITVVSGLARGIDGAAHEGALAATGATVGVQGCGLDVVYPPEHARLHARVAEHGLLLAEAPLGTPPEAKGFPKRNRIVSGLALGVIVVEAPTRSGALMTARLARETGREVFAVPGEVSNPRCAGCLELLRDGAALVRGAQDVVDELQAHLVAYPTDALRDPSPTGGSEVADTASADPLVAALVSGEQSVEALAEQVGRPVALVQQALLRLELSGSVVRRPGARYARSA